MADFITVEEARRYLGNDKIDRDLLKDFIEDTTSIIKRWCGWEIEDTNYQEYYDVKPNVDRINIKNIPIISVLGACDDGTAMTEGEDFTVDYNLGFIKYKEFTQSTTSRRLNFVYGCFTPGKDTFFINYNAGYETIPNTVKLAQKKLVFKEWNERGGDIKSMSSSTRSYTNYDLDMGFPPSVKTLLQNFKRID